MKKSLILTAGLVVLALVVGVVFGTDWLAPEPEVLTFVFHPGETAELGVLKERFGGVIEAIADEVGMDYEIVLGSSYAATMESLRNGTADVSRIGASMYVRTRDEIAVRPVVWDVIDGEDHYHAVLLGRPGIWDDPFTFDQLKGKTVAFVDPSSTSGYLAPATMMLEAGLSLDDLDAYSFTTTHAVAIETMLNGAVDVACTGNTLIPDILASGRVEGVDFVVLYESPPLVMDAWVIGPGVEKDKADRIADALLNLPAEAFDGSAISGFSPVDLSAYEFNEAMIEAAEELE